VAPRVVKPTPPPDWLHIAALTWHYGRADGSIRAYLKTAKAIGFAGRFPGNADSLNDWRL